MNEARPEVYDPACAKTAWERTLKFLKQALTAGALCLGDRKLHKLLLRFVGGRNHFFPSLKVLAGA